LINNIFLKHQAHLLSKKEGICFDEAFELIKNDTMLGKSEQFSRCRICDTGMKGKNLAKHMEKHHAPKIRWGRIPIIKKQREEKRKLRNVAGKPKVRFISGGLPSLGKKK